MSSSISRKSWGNFKNKDIYLFKIENKTGAFVELTNYGATVVSIVVPDKNNGLGNVILGFPELQGYLEDICYVGSTVGRFANRIARASFNLDGIDYQLEANSNGNSNHSASAGVNSKVFDYIVDDDRLIFKILSKDGEGGFPGNLTLEVCYQWTSDNALLITYTAITDRKTIVNVTNHCYFNLSAIADRNFLNHRLKINAKSMLESAADYIPTGRLVRTNGSELNDLKGINTCYVLDKNGAAATLVDPESGRVLDVYTSYPGLMLYTGDYLESRCNGHLGEPYKPLDGICLECQFYPDSPNHPSFPSTILKPDHLYQESITYKFSTQT
ncbi:aldose epimerase family protein [Pedobacter panaciterrae]|uniref:aldose epimerase family protein n=1 Tax=Pedobacter panaciterrae TaxID=363849 RepID=UPI00155D9F94|nr:aldose epimerase family protein [Pedobacter panaciterrae]NQX56011.1 galactose mutarotase [Pedobacter panaciterrae]